MNAPFFTVADTAFSPFMREKITVTTCDGVRTVRASVLLNQLDTQTAAGMTGDVFGVSFLLRDWDLPLPGRGSVITFGHPERKLYVAQVQPVGGVVHITAAENPSNGF